MNKTLDVTSFRIIMSALTVKFMQFNVVSHWIFTPWELVHDAEIFYGATFSLVDSKIDIKVYI